MKKLYIEPAVEIMEIACQKILNSESTLYKEVTKDVQEAEEEYSFYGDSEEYK